MHCHKGTILSAKGFLILLALSCSLTTVSQNKGLLWKISGNGLVKPSYIYATINTNDAKASELNEQATRAFDSSEVFVTETALDTGESTAINELTGNREYSLSTYLSKPEYADLKKILKDEYHLQLSYFEQVKPVFLYLVLLGEPGEKLCLSGHLYKLAAKNNKRVLTLQDAKSVAPALDSIDLKQQADLLKTAIRYHKKGTRDEKKLLQYYLTGDLEKALLFLQKYDYPKDLFRILIRNNDAEMSDRIETIIKQQPAFIALGVAHLTGEGNILQMLEKKGYKVVHTK